MASHPRSHILPSWISLCHRRLQSAAGGQHGVAFSVRSCFGPDRYAGSRLAVSSPRVIETWFGQILFTCTDRPFSLGSLCVDSHCPFPLNGVAANGLCSGWRPRWKGSHCNRSPHPRAGPAPVPRSESLKYKLFAGIRPTEYRILQHVDPLLSNGSVNNGHY
jgi:hypothetical protein